MSKKSFSPVDPFNVKTPDRQVINLSDVSNFLSHIEGRFLTVADASIVEKEQNRAVKSLIRNLVWEEFDVVRKWYYEQDDNGKTPFPFGQCTVSTAI